MSDRIALAKKHSFINESIFFIKSFFYSAQRGIKNIFEGVKKFTDQGTYSDYPIISISESDLWNKNDNEENWILTAGKIKNLRLASKKLNNIEIPAGEIFSFWKQIGNPNFNKGYVVGREIREGCIIPTVAGGLCQLSNALYDAALKANFQIIERHRHSQIVAGSLAEQNRDATVKWNYVDLRFCSDHPFRIEIQITKNKLIVRFKSIRKNNSNLNNNLNKSSSPSKLNDCYSCGNTLCFIQNGKEKIKDNQITTYILDEKWGEFENFVNKNIKEKDVVIIPFSTSDKIKNRKNTWNIKSKNIITYNFTALKRILSYKYHKNQNLFDLGLREDEKIAKKITQLIPIESTHLVISQNLLPFLYENFETGGRSYDVLMTRFPISEIQKELDLAYAKYPNSNTLKDFRAPEKIINLENTALMNASKIITAHNKIANLYNEKLIKIDWIFLKKERIKLGEKILFPSSIVGRKGAYELKKLISELNLSVKITGSIIEKDDYWERAPIELVNSNDSFENVRLVIYPTYIEHYPKLLIKAIELGIPILTTDACGLIPDENITIVETGDYDSLKAEAIRILNN